jgi:hypothetical protein
MPMGQWGILNKMIGRTLLGSPSVSVLFRPLLAGSQSQEFGAKNKENGMDHSDFILDSLKSYSGFLESFILNS